MSASERLTVDLPADLVRELREKVASGDIPSESEALREGLESVLAPELWDEEWLDREVGEIYDRVMAGEEELIPADQVFDEIRAEIASRTEHERDRG